MSVWSSILKSFESLSIFGKVAVVGGAVVVFVSLPFCFMRNGNKRKRPYKKDWKQGIVYLYQFPRFKSIPSASPYCLKLETWLRMADINYENVDIPITLRSREGMLPFVELNGEEYPDSAFAITSLTEIFSKESMETHLKDEQKSTGRAFDVLVENSLFWSYAQVRYVEQFPNFLKTFPSVPIYFAIMMQIYRVMAPKQMAERMKIIGIGRHSRNEIINIGLNDLRAISMYLGNKHYLLGYKPTRVDATLFGFLAQIIYVPIEGPHKDLMQNECNNLFQYCERIKGRFWPDWKDCTENQNLHSQWKKRD